MNTFGQIPNAQIAVGTIMTRNNGKFISIVTSVDPANGDLESKVVRHETIPALEGTTQTHTAATAYAVYSPVSELAVKK